MGQLRQVLISSFFRQVKEVKLKIILIIFSDVCWRIDAVGV